MERIVLNLENQGIVVPPAEKPAIFIACMGSAACVEAVKLAAALREAGTAVICSSGERSLKAQLRHANAAGAKYTAIIGEDEVKAGVVMLRNMQTSEQQQMPPDELLKLAGSVQ
jgi:histidyl-tRNA synthetase